MDLFLRLIKHTLLSIQYGEWIPLILIGIIFIHLTIHFIRKKRNISIKKELIYIFLFIYFCFGLAVTLIYREVGSNTGMRLYFNFGNPFGKLREKQEFCYCILNILFFIPWGFGLGLLEEKEENIRRIWHVLCTCFISTGAIECTQELTGRGYFEYTDLLTNMLGGVIGLCLATFVINKSSGSSEDDY